MDLSAKIEMNDQTLRGYITVSHELMRDEQWDQVRDLMEEALGEYPGEPELCLRYALSLTPASRDDAVLYARRAASLSQDDPATLTRCASLLHDLGEIEDAGKCIRSALPLVDEKFPLLADLFHLVGILAIARSNDAVAEEFLRRAYDLEPGGRSYAYRFAHVLATQNMFDEALDVIARGLEHGAPDEEELLALKDSILSDDRCQRSNRAQAGGWRGGYIVRLTRGV